MSNKYYIGYTNNLKQRVALHNTDHVPPTKNKGPWEIFHYEVYPDEKSAIQRERQIKAWKSRKAIERLKFKNKIEDPRFQ